METHIQFTTLCRRAWRLCPRASWTSLLVAVAALAVEIVGRQTTTDYQDAFALTLIGVVGGLVYCSRGKPAFAWARPAINVLGHAAAALRTRRFEVGFDLREQPPVPAASPPLIKEALAALGVTLAGLLLLNLGYSFDVRSVAIQVLYTAYLACLALLWGALFFVIVTCLLLPIACIHDGFASRHATPAPRSCRPETLAITSYFGLTALAGLTLPLWMATAVIVVTVTGFAATVWRRGGPTVALLWRQRGGHRTWSLDWRTHELQCVTVLALGLLALVWASAGGPALGLSRIDSSTPFTHCLGAITAWLGAAALGTGSSFASYWLLNQRRRNPARPCPTALHLSGSCPAVERAAAMLQRRGWGVRFAPDEPASGDVRIEVCDGPMPALGSNPIWPLKVSVKGLEVPELQALLSRRDQVQRRRLLLRGFERLFKVAARKSFRRGSGCWIAPHYWYISGMTRDTDEDDYDPEGGAIVSRVIGPSYHVLFSRAARQHFHATLRALDIDLLFVEDGVGFRRFRRMLRVLFEHYDVHGSALPIANRHFFGLPGTRVILHDYQLGSPLKRQHYPEPNYETLGRARILHVYRDRGEHEEPVPDPVDSQGLPVPCSR